MKYKTIIFDLDGTLLDTAPDVLVCANLARAEIGLPAITLAEAKKAIGPGPDNFAKYTIGDPDPKLAEKFLKIFRSHYSQHLLDNTRPFPGIPELLQQLDGFALMVATNKPRVYSTQILGANGLLPFFRAVIGPEDVAHNKPYPDMMYKALELTTDRPESAIMIGDTDNDMKSARAAAIDFCAVSWGYAPIEILAQDRPEYIIHQPDELLPIIANHSL